LLKDLKTFFYRKKSSSPPTEEMQFIEGPHSRLRELWFLFRVMREFVRGFRILHFVGPAVTVFGSARTKETNPKYELARKMGYELANMGFAVITGGGPGIMEPPTEGQRKRAEHQSAATSSSRWSRNRTRIWT